MVVVYGSRFRLLKKPQTRCCVLLQWAWPPPPPAQPPPGPRRSGTRFIADSSSSRAACRLSLTKYRLRSFSELERERKSHALCLHKKNYYHNGKTMEKQRSYINIIIKGRKYTLFYSNISVENLHKEGH